MILSSQFLLDLSGTEGMSELEIEAIKWYQILQQSENNFRSIGTVVGGLQAIGVDRPELVIESVKLLCSPKFIGSTNAYVAMNAAKGLADIAASVPEAADYMVKNKMEYLHEVEGRASRISSSKWEQCRIYIGELMKRLGNAPKLPKPKQHFFPPKTEYSVYEELRGIISSTTTDIWIIDPYADKDMVALIGNVPMGARIKILSKDGNQRLLPDLLVSARKYSSQYGNIEVRLEPSPGTQHDRFFIIDQNKVYQLGTSLNQAGSKATTVTSWDEPKQAREVVTNFNSAWQQAPPLSL